MFKLIIIIAVLVVAFINVDKIADVCHGVKKSVTVSVNVDRDTQQKIKKSVTAVKDATVKVVKSISDSVSDTSDVK